MRLCLGGTVVSLHVVYSMLGLECSSDCLKNVLSFDSVLDLCCANVGPTLRQRWTYVAPMLYLCCANVGPMLRQCWTDVAPILD